MNDQQDLGVDDEQILITSLAHDIEIPRALRHDHVAGEGDQLEVCFGYGALHLAHLHEGDEWVLETVDEQDRNGDSSVKGSVSCSREIDCKMGQISE